MKTYLSIPCVFFNKSYPIIICILPFIGMRMKSFKFITLLITLSNYVSFQEMIHDVTISQQLMKLGVILPEQNDFQGDFRDIVIHLRPQHYRNTHDNKNIYNYTELVKGTLRTLLYIMCCSSHMVNLVGIMNYKSLVIEDE